MRMRDVIGVMVLAVVMQAHERMMTTAQKLMPSGDR